MRTLLGRCPTGYRTAHQSPVTSHHPGQPASTLFSHVNIDRRALIARRWARVQLQGSHPDPRKRKEGRGKQTKMTSWTAGQLDMNSTSYTMNQGMEIDHWDCWPRAPIAGTGRAGIRIGKSHGWCGILIRLQLLYTPCLFSLSHCQQLVSASDQYLAIISVISYVTSYVISYLMPSIRH